MQRHVYYYTYVPQPFETVAAPLAGEPGDWLPPPATRNGEGWGVLLQAIGVLRAPVASRLATVEVGTPTATDQQVLVPLRWRASEHEHLYPRLRGDLGLDALGGLGCHLSLIGTYRPPLAVLGGAADVLLGHRVAEAVVRRFVLGVADRLAEV